MYIWAIGRYTVLIGHGIRLLFPFYIWTSFLFYLFCFVLHVWRKSFFECVVNQVFERKLYKVDELKKFVSQAFTDFDVNRNVCVTVCHSVGNRFSVATFMRLTFSEIKHGLIKPVCLLLARPVYSVPQNCWSDWLIQFNSMSVCLYIVFLNGHCHKAALQKYRNPCFSF